MLFNKFDLNGLHSVTIECIIPHDDEDATIKKAADAKNVLENIITKNIDHILQFDDNAIGISDFNGLGLFDGIMFCHYTGERKKYYEKAVSEGKYKVYALTDNDSIVLDN